jgi:dTDP-4-amino-4,6-dideoxygalactose transaminase
MSALNAAVGLVQMDRFDTVMTRRKDLWRAYAKGLEAIDGVRLVDVDVDRTVPFNCVVHILGRDRVFATMRARGIGVGVHYPPNHTQPAFQPWHRPLPITEQSGRQLMSLPFHPAMSPQDAQHVAEALAQVLETEGACAS